MLDDSHSQNVSVTDHVGVERRASHRQSVSVKNFNFYGMTSRLDVGARLSRIVHAEHKHVENTYQLGPHKVFQSFRARKVAELVVRRRIPKDQHYDPEWAKNTALSISNDVRRAVKSLPYDRYRYVVQTHIGQKRGQGVQCASRSLMEASTDTFCEYLFENRNLWCVVLVHALYFT